MTPINRENFQMLIDGMNSPLTQMGPVYRQDGSIERLVFVNALGTVITFHLNAIYVESSSIKMYAVYNGPKWFDFELENWVRPFNFRCLTNDPIKADNIRDLYPGSTFREFTLHAAAP